MMSECQFSLRNVNTLFVLCTFNLLINLSDSVRMQDVELMHMRYALESAVSALEVMGRSVADVKEIYQVALCYLKDLRSHLEAIKITPRKVEHNFH